MISQTKRIKSYKLEAALPGQTDVRPWRQVVEAAVDKSDKDGNVRVLYIKSTAPSAEQSPQPFVTTKFASRREDERDRLTAPRRVARDQHQQATERMDGLVKPMQNLPGAKPSVRQASRSITDLCASNNTKLFGLPCTHELLRQLKQIEAEQQAQRTAQQPPPSASHATNPLPKPQPIPPLKLGSEEKSASVPFVPGTKPPSGAQSDRPLLRRERPRERGPASTVTSTPTTPLHSETSTEEGSEQSSPGQTKAKGKSARRKPLQQQGARRNVKDSATTRLTPNPYEQWAQRISSLQDLFFPEDSSPKPDSPRRQPPASAKMESTDTPDKVPPASALPSPSNAMAAPRRMQVRPSLRVNARPPETKVVSPDPMPAPEKSDDKREPVEPQPPQADTQ
jgi:hypothetical protein